ncbi:RelA/SpoT domain-containing protein [Leisingera sp. SS27]|uniref:RelA/SpoT domain-containing protein n=1 Tax=Leisingera sp. SS27 TaxID=2979462 RepID=UPI00232AB93F|nr:RelA/SpoT domain-containing protein [Leisingera sp. SS27]MDC0660745.1 RelA/SpoT domain-containing protein [Leisingera sp. SS27]
MKKEEFRREFSNRREEFESLRTTVFGLISKAIAEAGVAAMPILSRVKDIDSAAAKFERKKYSKPFQQMTDVVGFRVVLYLEHEIETLERTIRKYFEVDEHNSVDKRKPSDVQTVGYRSLHLICTLGKKREKLPEYLEACDFPFEFQIRTALAGC